VSAWIFAAIGRILLLLGGTYLFSTLFGYVQQMVMVSVAQQTVYNLREDVSSKLARLPLKYYDATAHGDTLSRITNDVDVISQSLQQERDSGFGFPGIHSGGYRYDAQHQPRTHPAHHGHAAPQCGAQRVHCQRSQKYFVRHQRILGELNGHVEEAFTGHRIVKAYGLEQEVTSAFVQVNDELYGQDWKAQFVSGTIMPLIRFVGNLGYVVIAVAGGLFAAQGGLTVGHVQAFLQYSRQFGMPITELASIANVLQSTVAAAERVFELLDEEEEPAIPQRP